AHHVDGLAVHGTDLSAEAVGLARRNASQLGLAHRVRFHAGDLLAPFDTPRYRAGVDLVGCNPPYISSARVETMPPEISGHEPRLAFDGGAMGVSILTRLMHEAPCLLRAGGWRALEVGSGQGATMARRLRNDAAWDEVRECADGEGVVRGCWPGAPPAAGSGNERTGLERAGHGPRQGGRADLRRPARSRGHAAAPARRRGGD